MRPSLDPEIFMAKLLCKIAGSEPETLIAGGYDAEGSYFPQFTGLHLCDHKVGEQQQVFAWRKFIPHARKMIDEMSRNGQKIVQERPHFFHGDKEPIQNFWISWHHVEEDGFDMTSPWRTIGRDEHGIRFAAAIQARSDKEAVAAIFDAYAEPPTSLQIRFVEPQPYDWSPFQPGFKQADWMIWNEISEDGKIVAPVGPKL